MADINSALKQIIDESIKSFGISDYRAGTVMSVDPIKIAINDRIMPEGDQIILTEQVIEKKIMLKHLHQVSGNTSSEGGHSHGIELSSSDSLGILITIQEGLKPSDKVHMLAIEKGQRYIVISKIRSEASIIINQDSIWS